MTLPPAQPSRRRHTLHHAARLTSTFVLLLWLPSFSLAQQATPVSPAGQSPTLPAAVSSPQNAQITSQSPPAPDASNPEGKKHDRNHEDKDGTAQSGPKNSDRRTAAKLFLRASKHFEDQQYEEALHDYQRAAALDPTNRDYKLAAELTTSHAVTALIQTAARARIHGDANAERAALEQALNFDPRNIQVTEHLHELGDEAVLSLQSTASPYAAAAGSIAGSLAVEPTPGKHSFHIKADARQVNLQVFKTYGLQATVDDSVRTTQVRLDLDDATFTQAAHILSLITNSFYVPLDAHRVLVARETPENRKQFQRLDLETVYLPGLTSGELTEVGTLAKTVFELQQSTVDTSAGTITIRAPSTTLDAFNSTIHDLIDGHNQVLLEVNLIQLAHTYDRNTGIQPPQTITAFNVYAEEQSILNANQALVQQIISSGLAAPGDTLAILGILIASGQVTSSIFTNGIALFGGGLTQSALSPGPATANLNINYSQSRELDRMLLRLSDNSTAGSDSAAGTVRAGTRYPIQTSSFSSLSPSLPNIPGLTGAGSSSQLSSLLGALGGSVPNVPQVDYQDLGLTLHATPQVMRNSNVALKVELKIDALAGTAINGNPILNTRSYAGVVTLREGEGVVIVSELDSNESRAISGVPGLSEIPGLNNITDKDVERSKSSLLIIMTPHVIRNTQVAGHSPMLRIDRAATTR